MKKILTLALLVFLSGAAYSDTVTPRMGITKPTVGTTGWGTKLNSDMDIIDSSAAALNQSNTFLSSNTFTSSSGTYFTYGITAGSVTPSNLSTSQLVATNSQGVLVSTSLSSTNLPTDTAYLDKSQTWTAQQVFTSSTTNTSALGVRVTYGVVVGSVTASSGSITGAGGLNVSYGVSVGTFTGAGLSTCGDSTHGLAWSSTGNTFSCQSITGSASAGGSTGQLQYNNASALGGISDFTVYASSIVASGATHNVVIGTATITTLSNQIMAYKRPQLWWVSTSSVTVATGTVDGSTSAEILFPDGQYRTDSAAGHINAVPANVGSFSGGTIKAGLLSGENGSSGKFSVFAVKSQANASDFVLMLDTTSMVPVNYSALNTIYGTNSYVYLGTVANSDNNGTTALMKFYQAGNYTSFANILVGHAVTSRGLTLATSASAGSITYTYSAGAGTANIPPNIHIANIQAFCAAVTSGNECQLKDAVDGVFYDSRPGSGSGRMGLSASGVPVATGFIVNGNSFTGAMDINIVGWYDDALGVGGNPIF